MLCKERMLHVDNRFEIKTPMLIPSFSSKSRFGNDVAFFIEAVKSFYKGPLLVSAYDYELLKDSDLNFSSILFLDSGGYECINESVDNKIQQTERTSKNEWTRDRHMTILNSWNLSIHNVVISYDHPNEKLDIKEQIKCANKLFKTVKCPLTELLLKAGPDSNMLQIREVIENIESVGTFDVIGFTEKELGSSVEERMKNIQKIRMELDRYGFDTPIHILGSLDPIITPLYFFVGADIFDSISWTRYIFENGDSKYINSYGAKKFGISENEEYIVGHTIFHNLSFLQNLELELRCFTKSNDYAIFRNNCHFFKNTMQNFLKRS